MALVVKDRVRENSSTTGTGTFTLTGAVSGFQTFSSAIGNTNTTYYTILNGAEWEVGLGTVGAGTLSRDTVLSSSTGSKVDFTSGTKDVFCTYPAGKSIYYDASGNAPTFNQSTTGSAATLTTPRAIYGNNFDGSAALTQIIASTYGGTGNGFTKFSGPTTAEKTFTLPDASSTIVVQSGALGTPASGTLTSCTGLPISTGVSGLGTNVATALGTAVGSAGAFVTNGGALGTPSSGTLTNCTFPTLNQNTTGSAATFTSTTQNSQFNSVGVGTAASGTAGEIRATNNVTAYYSDERLKTKLGNIDNALNKVNSLSGFYYEANEIAQALGYEIKKEVGVSAQEVQAIMPEVVAPAPIDDKYLTVRYEKLVPLLIEAIKELSAEVDKLKVK